MIGERIKQIRKANGITQRTMAERLGIAGNTLAQYECGTRSPSESVLRNLCHEYDINYEWLVNGEGEMQQDTDDADIAALMRAMNPENDAFRRGLILALAKLPESAMLLFEQTCRQALGLPDKPNDEPPDHGKEQP